MGAALKIDALNGENEALAIATKKAIIGSQLVALKLSIEILEGNKCIVGPHHRLMCETLDRVVDGEIKRLIISIPPGYTKTACAVLAFIARGFVVNPSSRFIHTSYSQDLVLDNSAKIKQLLNSEEFRSFNGDIGILADTSAKGLWRTAHSGAMRATGSSSALTGFRAGQMDSEGFSGAVVIDDPLKVITSTSRKQTADNNRLFNNTIASRLATEDVPIIVIMQRIAAFAGDFSTQDDLPECGDLSEYLLRGGSGERWAHLELPVEIDNSLEYPREWTHGDPIPHGLPDGPLWDAKHTQEDIERLKRADIYTYAAQYAQRPKKRTGNTIIKREWFQYFDYSAAPNFKRIELFADTANKKGDANDYSVLGAAAEDYEGNCYILEIFRKKMTIPELHTATVAFWNKWHARGATKISIEDAASGTYLIQSLSEHIKKSVHGIIRDRDKFSRVNGVVEKISSGYVYLPEGAHWLSDFLNECEDFTDDDSHAYDDQVDVMVDIIENLVHMKPIKLTNTVIAGGY